MELTLEEQKIIEDFRLIKARELKHNTPIKVGYLKEQVYSMSYEGASDLTSGAFGTHIPESKIKDIISKIFVPTIPAGRKFECFQNKYGDERWEEKIYGVTVYNKWALENLRDIAEVS